MGRIALKVCVLLGLGVLAASFAGGLHPLGDSLAVFRPVWLVGLIIVSLTIWRWPWAKGALVLASVGLAIHLVGTLPKTANNSAEDLTIYQKNLLFRPADRGPLIADILEVNADVVTLQEVSRVNEAMLRSLGGAYPHQILCNGHAVGAVAILSKTAFEAEDCGTQPGFARGVTQIKGRAVQVYALHLHWPWPLGQAPQVARMMPDFVERPDAITLVGGDFNMVASGRTVARVARATGTSRVGRRMATFSLFGYPLGIDHVLATGGQGRVQARPLLGADHNGVVARVVLSAP